MLEGSEKGLFPVYMPLFVEFQDLLLIDALHCDYLVRELVLREVDFPVGTLSKVPQDLILIKRPLLELCFIEGGQLSRPVMLLFLVRSLQGAFHKLTDIP